MLSGFGEKGTLLMQHPLLRIWKRTRSSWVSQLFSFQVALKSLGRENFLFPVLVQPVANFSRFISRRGRAVCLHCAREPYGHSRMPSENVSAFARCY